MAAKTKNRTLGDLIRYELNPSFTREQYTLRNATGASATLTNPMGYPVKFNANKMELALSGDEATVDGLLLQATDEDAIATGTDYAGGKRAILVRGPAILSKDQLPINDVAGDAFVQANLITRLAALNIVVKSEPAEQTVQTS